MKSPTCRAGLLVTATDTGVGKTWITARLCRAMRRRGVNAGVWKPVQSGALPGQSDADSHLLRTISGVDDSEEQICPLSLKAALAPMVAAHLERREISFDQLLSDARLLFDKYDLLFAEGAGGLAVPLRGDGLLVHLATRIGFPLLVVARPGLGTVNHTLLTLAYAKQHGLEVIGVILNGYEHIPERVRAWENLAPGSHLDDSLSTNPLLIEQFGGVPVLGQVPRDDNGDEELFESCVQVDRIYQAVTRKTEI